MRRVTILMPCRDAERHLETAITSIRAQTFTEFEVVAVDDGSAVATFRTLQEWACQDGRVRVLRIGGPWPSP